ncbi:MAG: hypothetical protein QOG83_1701 [Alphaproteobacteria bacterium]|nr:hypothetical protein [Alphaproteobacteria bacterium]
MRTTTSWTALSAAMVATLTLVSAAQAASIRTFVSSTGTDTGVCSRASPCRTFNFAYSLTSPGGEIVALDSAGFGGVTNITTAVTIVGAVGGASVAVATGATGFTINAGASDVVVLRNLQISGSAPLMNTGIKLNSGRLHLENSSLSRLENGLNVTSSKATLVNTDIIANTKGIVTTGTGVDLGIAPFTGTTWVVMNRGNVVHNATAFFMHDPGANLFTIVSLRIGSSLSTFHAGNTVVMAGDGASCASSCTQLGGYDEQTGFTFN